MLWSFIFIFFRFIDIDKGVKTFSSWKFTSGIFTSTFKHVILGANIRICIRDTKLRVNFAQRHLSNRNEKINCDLRTIGTIDLNASCLGFWKFNWRVGTFLRARQIKSRKSLQGSGKSRREGEREGERKGKEKGKRKKSTLCFSV